MNWKASENLNCVGSTDWIAVYTAGELDNRNFLTWCRAGTPEGSCTFDLPGVGEYEFRYLVRDGFVDVATSGPRFVRGDVNNDHEVDVTDGINMLKELFLGTFASACTDARDVDDSGEFDQSDPINLLTFLFLGGFRVPLPFPGCGFDPTHDDFSDCEYNCQRA